MPYDYGEYYYEMEETGLSIMLGFYVIYFLVMLAISVGTYVLQSLGMYTIAKRRGIKNPWLAWVPLGNTWILGCISDQYRYVAKAQVKNKRSWLLAITIVISVLTTVFFVLFGSVMVQALSFDNGVPGGIVGSFAGMLGTLLIMWGLAIVLAVLQYMALYDLFCSCEPKNGTLYLVLSIFVNITLPIFVFICRNKDGGMPPRRPGYIPQPPAEQWQPAEPRPEPWENTSEE